MSWLNSSLSNIKGQITNFANEVLSEGPEEDQKSNEELNKAKEKLIELENIISRQNFEIANLRKQNAEAKKESERKSNVAGTSSAQNVQSMEDSWIWTEGDDETETSSQDSEKKKRSDSAELKSRILELEQENLALTSNLEELDSQHNVASQKLIEIKNGLQKKYDKLMQELQASRSENVRTVKEIDILKEQNVRLKTDFDKVQEDLSILQDENFELQKITQDFKSVNSGGDSEVQQLRKDLEILNKKCEELTFSNERLKIDIDKIDEDRAVLQDDNFSLQDQIATLRQNSEERTAKDFATLEKENVEMKNQIARLDDFKTDLEDAKKRAENLAMENERLKIDFDKVQEDMSFLQDENFQLQEEIEMLKNSSVPCSSESTDNIKAELDILNKEMEIIKKKESDLQSENEKLKIYQDQIEENRCELQDENFKLQDQIQSLSNSNYEEIKKENADLKAEVEKLSCLKSELDELQKKATDLKFENERLKIDQDKIEEDRAVLQDMNFELQDQITALKSEVSDSENAEKKYNDLKLEFDKLTQADAELRQELERFRTDLDKVEEDRCILQDQNFELQEEVATLKSNQTSSHGSVLETIRQENLDLKIQLEQKLKEQTDLRLSQAEHSDLSKRHEKLIVDFHTVEAHKKILENKNLELQQEILKLNNQLAEFKSTIDGLRRDNQQIQILFENNTVLKKQIEALTEVKNNLQHQVETLKTDSEKIEEDRCVLQDANFELQNELNSLKNNNSAESTTVGLLKQENEVLRQQVEKNSRLKIDYEKLEEDLSVLQDQNMAYQGDIVNLNSKIQQHLTEIQALKQKKDENISEQYERLKIDFEKVQEDCSVLQDENFDLQQKIKQITEKSNPDGMRSQIQTLLEEKQNLVNDLGKAQQKLSEMQKQNILQQAGGSEQNAKDDKLIKELRELNITLTAEKQAISMELAHYEKECAELMKNYDKIYLELELSKSNKLETISEKNEESFLNLEQQLENCSSLNQSLEDQYAKLEEQLKEVMIEKKQIEDKLKSTTDNLVEIKEKVKKLASDYEQEKSTLLFELNELKAVDKSMLENKCKEYEIALQSAIQGHENLLKENLHLKQELQRLVQNLEGHNPKVQILDSNSGAVKQQVDNGQLNRLTSELQTALDTITSLKAQNVELYNKYTSELQNYKAVEITLRHEIDVLRQGDANKNMSSENSDIQTKYLDLKNKFEDILKENERLNILNQQVANLQAAYSTLMNEKNELQKMLESSQPNVSQLHAKYENIVKENENLRTLQPQVANLQSAYAALANEKQELIKVIKGKHEENVTYHAEIQRLSALLQAELAKSQTQGNIDPASFEKLTDQVGFLREKCDILTNSLVTEQANVKLLNQEKKEVEEKATMTLKELERLRQHLVEIENSHTQEIMELDMRNNELQTKISSIEEHAIYNNTAYTSASIRANQQAETLQTQLNLMSQQRDELLVKMSDTEDKYNKQVAALTNLQCALEQFQRDKDQEIQQCTERIRNTLELERKEQTNLRNELQALRTQLSEQQQGLMAAGRLASQLESSQSTVQSLRQELKESQDKFAALHNKMESSKNNQADKIEKSLVKNLMLGYITAGQQNDKAQILKIISAVLDFNQSECDRIGLLNNQKSSWFGGSILRLGEEGLAKAFVEFLEKESLPRPSSIPGGPSLLQIQKERKQSLTKVENVANSSRVSPAPSTSSTNIQQPLSSGNALLSQATHSENVLPTFAPPRSASSILKDVLKDSNNT